jgi:ribosomal protein L29
MRRKKKANRTRTVACALTAQEYDLLEKNWKKSTIIKLSEYMRRMLFGKPVTFYVRNRSLDELVAELIPLRRELNKIGLRFDQAAELLRSPGQLRQLEDRLIQFERQGMLLAANVAEIKLKINSISEQWLQ